MCRTPTAGGRVRVGQARKLLDRAVWSMSEGICTLLPAL